MPRLSVALGACVGVLSACGSGTNADLFGTPNSSAGATGGAAPGIGFGGAGAAGFGGATGGASSLATGGVVLSGGLSGQGGDPFGGMSGYVYGLGGVATGGSIASAGGGVGNGGIGDGGPLGNGGIVGDGGSAATGGSSADGGAGGEIGSYASNATADCNGNPCATANGSACCIIVSNNNGTRTVYGSCGPATTACAVPFSAKAFCDGPEDCARGAVCCGTLGTVPGLYTELACVPAANCTGTGKQVMCHPARPASCTSNVCNPTLTLPDGYGACG